MDRVVVISGGASGIGLHSAIRFAAEGAKIVILDANEEKGRQAEAKVGSAARSAQFFACDVANAKSVGVAVEQIRGKFGGIDVLVNSAGILDLGNFADTDEATWDRVINVNLKGSFLVTQAALPLMIGRQHGRIIFISSLAGRTGGLRTGPAYSASKAGVIGLARAAARYCASHGITANAVAPGTTDTEMAAQFSQGDIERLKTTSLIGRLVAPEEIAETVYFLASERAAMITGAVVDVNGGAFIG